jgi:hypothetical protein
MFDEGDEVFLRAKVFRADSMQALVEFVSMEGIFSIRVPVNQLVGALPLPPETHHDWIEVPEGTRFTKGVPFKFCSRCDREEWSNGVVRKGRSCQD